MREDFHQRGGQFPSFSKTKYRSSASIFRSLEYENINLLLLKLQAKIENQLLYRRSKIQFSPLKFILVMMLSANEIANIKQTPQCLLLDNIILHSVLNGPFTG